MTATQVLAALLTLAMAGGLALLISGTVGTYRPPRPATGLLLRLQRWWTPTGRYANRALSRRILTIATVAAVIAAWLITGWPVVGLLAGAAVVGVPWLLTTGRDATAAIDRLAGIEAWVRRLRDTVAVGVGLQQAIAASRRYAPPAINDEINSMVSRLQAGWGISVALHALAADLDDAAGDQVVAALLLNAEDRGDHLPDVLGGIADTAAKEIAMRKTVEAQRQEPRMVTKIMTILTVLVLAGGMLVPNYVQPYSTTVGQLVLAALAGMDVALLIWIRRLTLPVKVPRFLASPQMEGEPS